MSGLKLKTIFHSSEDCLNDIFYWSDDIVHFLNNLTVTFDYTRIEEIRLMYPVLRFTQGLYDNASNIPVDCFEWYT